MGANVNWTSQDDAVLINFVRSNECLYNKKCKNYRQAQLKLNLWNSIGGILEKSGTECCKRWAYVRDYYIRRRGKPGTGSSGEAAKKRSDLLSFLDSLPSSQRNSITNLDGEKLQESEPTEDYIDDIASQHLTKTGQYYSEYTTDSSDAEGSSKTESKRLRKESKKKKKSHSKERLRLLKEIAQQANGNAKPTETELDETDLFFKSMAQIVKKLPRYEQIQLRMQIGSLVGNAELRCISKESNQQQHPGNVPEMESNSMV